MKKALTLFSIPFLLVSCEELGLSRKTNIEGLKLEFNTYGINLNGDLGPIFFLNEESGYLTVSPGVCKTDDSGKTWRRLNLHTDNWVTDVFFFDDSEGYIVSNGISCGPSPSPGCISTNAIISKTTDGGETWSQTYVPSGSLGSIYFNTRMSGFAVGAKIFSTVDGGVSWNELNINGAHQGYSQVEFVNDKKGLMFTRDGKFLRSYDGGLTWEVGPLAPFVPEASRGRVSVVSEGLIYFSTEFQIYKSTDWGSTWHELPKPPTGIFSLVGVSEDVVFIVGRGESAGDDSYHAMLYYSTDGCKTWRGTRKVFEVSTLWGAHFPSPDVGYAYGGKTLLKITRD